MYKILYILAIFWEVYVQFIQLNARQQNKNTSQAIEGKRVITTVAKHTA